MSFHVYIDHIGSSSPEFDFCIIVVIPYLTFVLVSMKKMHRRRMTENMESGQKKINFRKKTDLGSDTEETLFNPDDFKNPLNVKELLNTINAVEASDYQSYKPRVNSDIGKHVLSKTIKDTAKKQKKYKMMNKKNSIPLLKITDSVLKQMSAR